MFRRVAFIVTPFSVYAAGLTADQVDFGSAYADFAYVFGLIAGLLVTIMGIKSVFNLMGR